IPTELLPRTGQETGIAVGLTVVLLTAAGVAVANPRHYRKAEQALKKTHKRVSRRKKGSKRRAKAVHQCAKQHQHVRRQRADFHHKTALVLVRVRRALRGAESVGPPEPPSCAQAGCERPLRAEWGQPQGGSQ